MDPSYYDEALYYKGIAYMRPGNKTKALAQFNIITDMFSPYKDRAKTRIQSLTTESK